MKKDRKTIKAREVGEQELQQRLEDLEAKARVLLGFNWQKMSQDIEDTITRQHSLEQRVTQRLETIDGVLDKVSHDSVTDEFINRTVERVMEYARTEVAKTIAAHMESFKSHVDGIEEQLEELDRGVSLAARRIPGVTQSDVDLRAKVLELIERVGALESKLVMRSGDGDSVITELKSKHSYLFDKMQYVLNWMSSMETSISQSTTEIKRRLDTDGGVTTDYVNNAIVGLRRDINEALHDDEDRLDNVDLTIALMQDTERKRVEDMEEQIQILRDRIAREITVNAENRKIEDRSIPREAIDALKWKHSPSLKRCGQGYSPEHDHLPHQWSDGDGVSWICDGTPESTDSGPESPQIEANPDPAWICPPIGPEAVQGPEIDDGIETQPTDALRTDSYESTERLLNTTDAQVWAQEFCRFGQQRFATLFERDTEMSDDINDLFDEGWMIGWFANAMQTALRIHECYVETMYRCAGCGEALQTQVAHQCPNNQDHSIRTLEGILTVAFRLLDDVMNNEGGRHVHGWKTAYQQLQESYATDYLGG
jgi:hypothetical protein